MAKILTIEHSEPVAREIARALIASGLTVDVALTGREGLAKVMGGSYDVVTLDRSLPDLDGLTIITTMRCIGMETPVLSPKEETPQTTFRERTLDEIKRVVWDTAWGWKSTRRRGSGRRRPARCSQARW